MLDICYIFRSQIRDIFRSQIWDLLRPQTRDAFDNNSPNHLAYTHTCVCVCVCVRARARACMCCIHYARILRGARTVVSIH